MDIGHLTYGAVHAPVREDKHLTAEEPPV